MKRKTKLQHHGSGGCMLQLLLMMQRLGIIRNKFLALPVDGLIEMYSSEEEREKR